MSKESIYVFDDGSIGSQLLQHELKDQYDIQTIKVAGKKEDIEDWFNLIKQDYKIHLHFCYEDYTEAFRRTIQKIEAKGFKNRIVLSYEGMDCVTMNKRAKQKGLGESKVGVDVPEFISEPKVVSDYLESKLSKAAEPKEYTAYDKIKDEGLESKLYKDENVNQYEEEGKRKKRKSRFSV